MDVLMEMTWSDDIRRKGSRLAVPHFVSCLAWLWHPAQLAAGQWDGPGVKHCAVRTTSGRYLTVISQSGVLQGPGFTHGPRGGRGERSGAVAKATGEPREQRVDAVRLQPRVRVRVQAGSIAPSLRRSASYWRAGNVAAASHPLPFITSSSASIGAMGDNWMLRPALPDASQEPESFQSRSN